MFYWDSQLFEYNGGIVMCSVGTVSCNLYEYNGGIVMCSVGTVSCVSTMVV